MNKSDFKIGQWVTSTYYCGVIAIKFNGWDNIYDSCPKLTEAITDNGDLVKNFNGGGIYNSDYGKYLKLIDLAEIQKYLPDGHPDKFKAESNTIEVCGVDMLSLIHI